MSFKRGTTIHPARRARRNIRESSDRRTRGNQLQVDRFPNPAAGGYSGSIMAQAYTPGLKVTDRTLLQRRRVLPIHGEVLVEPGDKVAARDVVAQALLPGPITPVNAANILSISPGDLPAAMLVSAGSAISAGQ